MVGTGAKGLGEKKMPYRAQLAASKRAIGLITLGLAAIEPAWAQMKVRVGQPQTGTFQFVPLQVATETGIFKRRGIDVEVISFAGGPRVQQALAADSIDVGIGSGPELAFVGKGRTRNRGCSHCGRALLGRVGGVAGFAHQIRRGPQRQNRQHLEQRIADGLAGTGAVPPIGLGCDRDQAGAARLDRRADGSAQDAPNRRHDRRSKCRL